MNTARLQWVDQSAFDLRLRVFDGPLDRACLQILRQASFRCGGFSIWAAIIGSSHAFHLTADAGGQISELCSCRDAGHVRSPVHAARLSDRSHRAAVATATLHYGFSSATLSWADGKARASTIMDAAAKGPRSGFTGLFFAFPTEGGATPYTALTARAVDGGVRIETAHAYPNEANIVLTTSNVRVAKKEIATVGRLEP